MIRENILRPFVMHFFIVVCISLFLASPLSAGPILVSQDTDLDGLKDLDEVSAEIEVPAGPSDENILTATTGYCLSNGDMLLVRASGTVSTNAEQGPTSGPAGIATQPAFPTLLPDAPFLALIGRLNGGSWFLVGPQLLIDSTQEGEIEFAVNEVPGSFSNNAGSFLVELGKGLGTSLTDPDSDKDGVLDGADGAPLDPLETLDTDGDGLGNRIDPDDDDDGLMDSEETGGSVEVLATGSPDTIPEFRFPDGGLRLQPGEVCIFSATGILAAPIIDATSTPNGRTDLNTAGLTLALPGAPLYRLLGRFANGEWVPLGEDFLFGYASSVTLTEETHHLGDNTAESWEDPLAEGELINLPFNLDGPVLGSAVLSVEVWSSREDNRVFLNGQTVGRLCVNRNESFIPCEVPLPSGLFQSGQNLIQIVASEDDDPLDITSRLDDFQIRNATVDFLPSPYRFIDLGTHHLGDNTISTFEVPAPEGIEYLRSFFLSHKPDSGVATLSIDAYDVTSNRPDVPVYLNGTLIGSLCERDPSEFDFWDQCEIPFDVNLLKVGTNVLRVESVDGGQDTGYDDFMIRMMTIDLPYEGGNSEVLFSYNERIGQYTDNTGLYTVLIGSGTTSDPLKLDTDEDGIDDKTEVEGLLDPKDPNDAAEDPDSDDLTNLEEVKYETEFFDPDTDGDRVGDGAEVMAETDPTNRLEPRTFDYFTDGVLDSLDYLRLLNNWYLEVEELSFDEVGDVDNSGRIDADDVFLYQNAIFR